MDHIIVITVNNCEKSFKRLASLNAYRFVEDFFKPVLPATTTSFRGALPGFIEQHRNEITSANLWNLLAPATSDGVSAGMKKRLDTR